MILHLSGIALLVHIKLGVYCHSGWRPSEEVPLSYLWCTLLGVGALRYKGAGSVWVVRVLVRLVATHLIQRISSNLESRLIPIQMTTMISNKLVGKVQVGSHIRYDINLCKQRQSLELLCE